MILFIKAQYLCVSYLCEPPGLGHDLSEKYCHVTWGTEPVIICVIYVTQLVMLALEYFLKVSTEI